MVTDIEYPHIAIEERSGDWYAAVLYKDASDQGEVVGADDSPYGAWREAEYYKDWHDLNLPIYKTKG